MNIESDVIWIESITGSKKLSNWLWASILLFAGVGFVLAGMSSYLERDLLPFLGSKEITFAPQGLIMFFYGIGSIFLSTYLFCTILLGIGSGYNELDQEKGTIDIFRWGFPGKNRRIRVRCLAQDVQSIRFRTEENLAYSAQISIMLTDQQELPLTQVLQDLSWEQIEEKAARLAQFLRVPIEGV